MIIIMQLSPGESAQLQRMAWCSYFEARVLVSQIGMLSQEYG